MVRNKPARPGLRNSAMSGYRFLADLIGCRARDLCWVRRVRAGGDSCRGRPAVGDGCATSGSAWSICWPSCWSPPRPLFGIVCPLTTWENDLREAAGETVQEGSFVGHWVHELIFVEVPPWGLTLGYCLFALAVVLAFVLVPPRLNRAATVRER